MEELFEIAKQIEFNAKAEAQAVYDYTDLIKMLGGIDIEEDKKQEIADSIQEIIADELNHQNKLQSIYTYLTTIEPNKD